VFLVWVQDAAWSHADRGKTLLTTGVLNEARRSYVVVDTPNRTHAVVGSRHTKTTVQLPGPGLAHVLTVFLVWAQVRLHSGFWAYGCDAETGERASVSR
jgi:hypothetical protein